MSLWSACYELTLEEHERIEQHLAEQYERMADENALETLHIDGEEFSYAVIPRWDIAPDPPLAQKFVNNYAYGFTTEVPRPYRPIVAAHEYVENRHWDHEDATERELAMARDLDRLEGYLDWVEEYYPQRMADLAGR